MAKKLKKKQRPMTIEEWRQTSGATASVLPFIDSNHPAIDKLSSLHETFEDEDMLEVTTALFHAYHEYVCAHIAHLLEAKR